MSVTSPPRVSTNELIDALILLSEPVKFKAHIKELAAATKKINNATKEYDAAVKIAATIERANEFAQQRRTEIDKLEARTAEMVKTADAKYKALKISMDRREGAHKIVVKEHNEAGVAQRDTLSKQARSLATRENTLERGKAQLAQDNHALKTAQDALSERRARLADAIKN